MWWLQHNVGRVRLRRLNQLADDDVDYLLLPVTLTG
jgi:hypothetical protein